MTANGDFLSIAFGKTRADVLSQTHDRCTGNPNNGFVGNGLARLKKYRAFIGNQRYALYVRGKGMGPKSAT